MTTRTWTGGAGTWDGSNTASWSGGVIPIAGDAVVFDGTSGGGTVIVNTTVNVASITMGAFTSGTLDFLTNSNSVTLNTFSATGTVTRGLNMGNNTWTINGTSATVWDITNPAGLTLNANGSTLVFAGTPTGTRTFTPGTGKTYNIVTCNALSSPGATFFPIGINESCTIGTFNVATPQFINVTSAAATVTVTNPISWAGSFANPLFIGTLGGGGGTLALAAGSTIDHAALFGFTITGSPTITNSVGAVSGPTILPPGGSKFIGG